ncbi:MIP/aquaporin family protein [Pelosinus propionicus]|uniref:Glycerol uptake facilitator protein n=1 Tax=Pelosinus propionicus DSM 13327 TaxID=1123291 RepID=A0A1I4PXQ9_9FIRM|nr:MIP/aquaporin family protein [Pelosinus propionicus]SFM32135.1 glycerol uptake facilitator protein [Pelosinus propionicus DSM 13327]
MPNLLLGEFLGSAIFFAFGCGVVANVSLKESKGNGGGPIVVYTGWALAVMMGVTVSLALGNTGDLNPAVTFYKLLMGAYTVPVAISVMIAQTIGGVLGGALVWLAYLPHWEATEDKGAKLGVFCTSPAIRSYGANALCEFVVSTMLFLVFFSMGSKFVSGANGFPPGFGTYMVGMAVWAVGCCFCGPTGYALNPARDLGPRIAHAILPIAGKGGSDWAYAWVPVVAPMAGGGAAFVIAKALGLI